MAMGLLRAEFGAPANDIDNPEAPEGGGALALPSPEGEQGPFGGPTVELSGRAETDLVGYVRRRFETMVRFRHKRNLHDRFRFAMRAMNGEYDTQQLAEILRMGGATTFSQLIASKAQAATALLQDIYLSGDRPWAIRHTPEPEIAPEAMQAIEQLVQAEVQGAAQMAAQTGAPMPTPDQVKGRRQQLEDALRRATIQRAREEAEKATRRCEDLLREGGFYQALADLLLDLPVYPYAALKGPVVEMRARLKYGPSAVPGQPADISVEEVPTLTWRRVNPIDLYFVATASSVSGVDMLERCYYTRHDLSALLDVPGWRHDRIETVLNDHAEGLRDWDDTLDEERAAMEGRESPSGLDSETICGAEYHGFVQGETLLDLGVDPELIPDPRREYLSQLWVVGQYVLKAQVSPSLRRRHPYFVTAYKKSAGSLIGSALPDLLRDCQDVANAALRNLVNNMGLASGPQVVIMTNRFDEGQDSTQLYPWKQWWMQDEPGQGSLPPIQFYQPQSNAQELLMIYKEMVTMADEVSLIPRYQHGGQAMGAGRTASGLSMLMSNASKLQQMVAMNVDEDILSGTLQYLYDMLMLTSDDMRGDEQIDVWGVKKVASMEAERARQIEFLQITANPMDMQLLGAEGRAGILRELAKGLKMEDGEIVPTREDMAERQRQAQQMQMTQAASEAQGQQGGTSPSNPTGPRANNQQARNMAGPQRGGAQ